MRAIIIIGVLIFASNANAQNLFWQHARFGNRVMSHYGNFGNHVIGYNRAMRTQPVRRVRRVPQAVYYYRY